MTARSLKWGLPIVLLAGLLFYVYETYNPYSDGQQLYDELCADCHGPDGQGLKKLVPPVAHTSYMTDSLEQVVCIIQNGRRGPFKLDGQTYNYPMPAYPDLTHNQIANIVNYINYEWNEESNTLASDEAQQLLRNCP